MLVSSDADDDERVGGPECVPSGRTAMRGFAALPRSDADWRSAFPYGRRTAFG